MTKNIIWCIALSITIWGTVSRSENPPINNNNKVDVDVDVDLNVKNDNSINIVLSQELVNTITIHLKNYLKSTKKFAKELLHRGTTLFQQLIAHKWKVLGLCLLAAYSSLNARMLYIKHHLTRADCWSLWRENMSLEELFALPQHELGTDIVQEALRRHALTTVSNELLPALTKLIQDITAESALLEAYQWYCSWTQKFYISRITFSNQHLYNQCAPRHERLAYLKRTVINWLADYTLDQATRAVKAITERYAYFAN